MKRTLFLFFNLLSLAAFAQLGPAAPNTGLSRRAISLNPADSAQNVLLDAKTSTRVMYDIAGKIAGPPPFTDSVSFTSLTQYNYLITAENLKKFNVRGNYDLIAYVVYVNGSTTPYLCYSQRTGNTVNFGFGSTPVSGKIYVSSGIKVANAAPVDLSPYPTTVFADGRYQFKGDYALNSALNGLATQDYVNNKGFLLPASLQPYNTATVDDQKYIAQNQVGSGLLYNQSSLQLNYGYLFSILRLTPNYFTADQTFNRQTVNNFTQYPTAIGTPNGVLFNGSNTYSLVTQVAKTDGSALLTFQLGPNDLTTKSGRISGWAFDRDITNQGNTAVTNKTFHEFIISSDSLYYNPSGTTKYNILHTGNAYNRPQIDSITSSINNLKQDKLNLTPVAQGAKPGLSNNTITLGYMNIPVNPGIGAYVDNAYQGLFACRGNPISFFYNDLGFIDSLKAAATYLPLHGTADRAVSWNGELFSPTGVLSIPNYIMARRTDGSWGPADAGALSAFIGLTNYRLKTDRIGYSLLDGAPTKLSQFTNDLTMTDSPVVGGLYTGSVDPGGITSIYFQHNLSGITANSVITIEAHDGASSTLLTYRHYVTCDATAITITFPDNPTVVGSNPVFNVQIIKKP